MDDEYMKNHTRNWYLEDSNENLELYTYFDTVDWEQRYAIKKNGKVVYDFENEEHGNKHSFFEAVCKIIL